MNKTVKLNTVLILAIAILFVLSGSKMFQLLGYPVQKANGTAQINVVSNGVSTLQSSSQVSSSIQNSELVSSSDGTNSNFWYNEKFIPGNVDTTPSDTLTCNTEDYISIHGYWSFVCVAELFGQCVAGYPWYNTVVTPQYSNMSTLVGYLGYPQTEASGLWNEISAKIPYCKVNGASFNYPDLVSADVPLNEIQDPGYCLPPGVSTASISENGNTYSNSQTNYPNFINWGASSIYAYSGYSSNGQTYYYAINTSFYVAGNGGPGAAVPPSSTLIIPSISCGSTFPNNYITFAFPGFPGVPAIASLSGFTPSVGLATDDGGIGVTYVMGGVFWPPLANFLFAYTTENIDPTFSYGYPTLNYAQFPSGNKGDSQYVNVSYLLTPSISSSYLYSGENANVSLYASNITFASITGLNSVIGGTDMSWQNILNTLLFNNIIDSLDEYSLIKLSTQNLNVNAYSLPNLQAAYYPMLGTGTLSDAYTYDYFRTDGILPFCATTGGKIDSDCTYENTSSINPMSYERYWTSGFANVLNIQPYAPAYDTGDQLNNFTALELDSFCFYGENFNTATGVYTSPSYTGIIPPIAAENYTSALGKCNALFNNTNCFSPSHSTYINFNDGIFAQNIGCTPNGILAKNITDAWINSIYIANDAGNFCGDFLGQKNLADPAAGSTSFSEVISTGCPTFSSNDSTVSLVVTVKNVGNDNITEPYLAVLFRDTNISQMFYSSNGNLLSNDYGLYETFVQNMEEQDLTGVIGVNYNSSFDTNMFVYNSQDPINPIPIQQLFANSQDYLNGPFNNSLLGLWMYAPTSQSQAKVIRTANTFLNHASSNVSGAPVIAPNGTASFTVEIPMALFEALLAGKFNVGVYFGNTFNVNWLSPSGAGISDVIAADYPVNPLIQSGSSSVSSNYNNEYLDPAPTSTSFISPPWQYIVSYTMNMSQKPFSSTAIYSDSINLSVGAPSSNQSVINSTIVPTVVVVNGTGKYGLTAPQLVGSSISCFASEDNVQDFSVFWSTQVVSPPNLEYAVENSISPNGAVISNAVITRWVGLLFSPYTGETVLNYDNLPVYPVSQVSMRLQKPTINNTATTSSSEAFVYFGNGTEAPIFSNLSSNYDIISAQPTITVSNPPASVYGFTLIANNLIGNSSILRIAGTKVLNNYSQFTDKSVTLTLSYDGCTFSGQTNGSQILVVAPSDSSCATNMTSNFPPSEVDKATIEVSSGYGPFFVEMYNTSQPDLSNLTHDGTLIISSNVSTLAASGTFTTYLNVTAVMSNGFTLIFGVEPQTTVLDNSYLYLHYMNDTPFTCDIVNNIFDINNLAASEIKSSPGEYSTPKGTILCYLKSTFTGLRAVFVNSSNQYEGSGDIGLGVSVQNVSATKNWQSIYITYNGAPINSQDVNLVNLREGSSKTYCDLKDYIVTNGLLNFSTSSCIIIDSGNYSLNFTRYGPAQGQTSVISTFFQEVRHTPPGRFIAFSPLPVSDNPSSAENISFNTQSIPSSVPVSFSTSNAGTCYGIRILSNSPYPYAEVPYQVTSSSSSECTYEFIMTESNAYNKANYIIFGGEQASPATYSNNWLNISSTPYADFITTKDYSLDLLRNCESSNGPCVSDFSVGNSGSVGNLLVNNVSSASSASIAETVSGPIEDCFAVSYSASQQVIWSDSGFGEINYNENKLYQITNPSSSIASTYCIFNGAKVITDSVSFDGGPLSFNIQDNLIANFSYTETYNAATGQTKTFYVPPLKFVGYNGSYSKMSINEQEVRTVTVPDPYELLQSCVVNNGYPSTSVLAAGIPIPSTLINNPSGFYCLFGLEPTYTSELAINAPDNVYTTTGGETIGLLYRPGVYNLSIGGVNSTVYGDCALTSEITSTSNAQTLSSLEKLYVLTQPQLEVNGTFVNYNPSNSGENFMVTYTAPVNAISSVNILFNPSGGSMISECPVNSTIENYTLCTATLPSPAIKLENGSYDGIEGIPNPTIGNYNNSNGNYGPGDYIGGGCLIGTFNGKTYSCQPTYGSLSINLPSPTTLSSSTGTVTYTVPNLYESSQAPINIVNASFTCSGWIYAANQSSGAQSFSNMSVSCSNGNASTNCASRITVNSGPGNGNIQASCTASDQSSSYPYVASQSVTLAMKAIKATQSEQTGVSGSLTCGNETNFIQQNVEAGAATWTPYSLNGLAEVGGCQAPRDVLNITIPTISNTTKSAGFQETYSCPAGYSGTIITCASLSATHFSGTVQATNSCTETSSIKFESYNVTEPVSNGYGEVPLGCNPFSEPNYTTPTVADGCIADHIGETSSTNASYALQYMNTTLGNYLGIGIGVISQTVPSNMSIPQSGLQAIIKDQYMSGLSVSQYEATNIVTDLYPTNLLLSNLPAQALFTSSLYPYDLLNVLLLQNPYFKIYGMPGFVNGSVFDYAMNLFTGGTSANCASGVTTGGYDLYNFGEGELCSGQNPLSDYANGIYLSLGTLNEGLHAIEFYSVSETGKTASPTVNVYNTVSSAYSLNTACANGNNRVVTSEYKGGKWTINITSDEGCNPINNKLYGYVINCIYQTPGNLTFVTASRYYLGYNLPTLWNVSYTLLVSPKTYEIIPVPVYKVNASFGSYLSLSPKYTTTFNEIGLPKGKTWTVTYSTQTTSTTDSSIEIVSAPGTYTFSVETITNTSATLDCTTTYTPSPPSGTLKASSTLNITFTHATSCITTFSASSLPSGYTWAVDYDGANKSGSTSSDIAISTLPGPYSYSAIIEGLKCTASGTVAAGSSVTPSWSCTTKFTESGLPSGTTWSVVYDGTNYSSTSATNTITTGAGKFSYTVSSPTVNGCTYSPSPSASNGLAAGSSQSVTYTPSCTTAFTESGLPSGTSWTVIHDGKSQSSTSTTDNFVTGSGTFSYAINSPTVSGCTYSPSPSSGSLTAGSSQSISYTSSCVTTFTESGLPSGYTWSVTYDGITNSASTGSPISISSPAGSYTASASVSGLSCTVGSQYVSATSSVSFSSWSCTVFFYISSGNPLPSSNYDETVTLNGVSLTANWGNNRVTLPDGATGLEFSFGGLSPDTSLSWSVNSPINGIFGDCGTLTGYDQWNANVSSGNVLTGENVWINYAVSCPI